jgi:hypothetical protein
MAFIAANFSPAGAQSRRGRAPQMHTYKTADAVTTVRVAGYFNEIRTLLNIGDLIYCAVVTNLDASNEALAGAHLFVVKDKSTTAVDVTDGTAVSVTDTD